jgi:hypothetical protein
VSIDNIRRLKFEANLPKPAKVYSIAKKSKKRIEREKKMLLNDDNYDGWFEERRKNLVGVCQCGCGEKSQKKDDTYYRHCICHIFPKRLFKSVATHPMNFVERAFWGGCHTNLDEQSMDKWVGMADWDDIKAKVEAMLPYIAEEEKKHKFYSQLENLIREN